MANDLLLTRDEVLGGLPARRANALLFLIESRAAHLAARARHRMTPFDSEELACERELAFVEAFALGREPPLRPTIQDLERHAPQCAGLVPDNPGILAAVAHLLGQRYQFTAGDIPGLRALLRLDTEPVRKAHERLYREPMESIYAERPSLATRLRWKRAALGSWLESLPPFWTAFALTLTETVGAGILALPIAFAGVGPLPGILLLIVLGLVNVVTIAWLAEAAARTASVRFGGAYFGRLVTEYLGRAGGLLLTVALVIIGTTVLIAYAIGLASTLASATGVAMAVWIALLFAGVLYMVSRDSLSSTVASALGIGAVNLALLIVLALLGLVHLRLDHVTHMAVPGLGGQPWDLSILGLVFGVVLCAYFGHTSVGNCAAIVLRRDPSSRSLIFGVVAAQVIAVVVYAVWVLAINGSIPAGNLAGYTGTALDPLADVAGPVVYAFGSIFVVLAMGMGSIHMSLGLVNVVRERMPRRAQPVMLLQRGTSRLVFEPRGGRQDQGPRVVLTYLGLSGGQPRLRLHVQARARVYRAEATGVERWSAAQVLADLPDSVRAAVDLVVEPLAADDDQMRLHVTTGMRMAYEGSWVRPGLDLAGLIGPDAAGDDGDLLRWILRQGEVGLSEAAVWAGVDEPEMAERLRRLVEAGKIRAIAPNGTPRYRASVARRRARQVPGGLEPGQPGRSPLRRMSGSVQGRVASRVREDRVRALLPYLPVLCIFLLTEWLVLTDRASFTGMLGFTGTIAVPIFAGLLPTLILVSSRRRGDLVPGVVSRLLGQRWLLVGVYLLFLVAVLLHGLVIWDDPVPRAAALAAGVVVVAVTAVAIRGGAFAPRTVVSLREDRRDGAPATFEIVSGGHSVDADVEVAGEGGTRHAIGTTIELPEIASLERIASTLPTGHAEVKAWANRITPDGEIESLPASLCLTCNGDARQVDLRLAGGTALLALGGDPCAVEIAIDHPQAFGARSLEGRGGRKRAPDVHALLSTPADDPTLPTTGDR